jgi:adenine-specific DNA methylase
MFYRKANGQRFDAIRQQISDWIEDLSCSEHDAHCLLAPLLYKRAGRGAG